MNMLIQRRNKAPAAETPAIEPIDKQVDAAPFLVREPRDIAALLQTLAADAEPLTLYPADGAPRLSARIAAVDAAAGRLIVEAECRNPPEPGAALLVAQPQGIKLQFRSSGEWLPGTPARWDAALPEEIVHLQRRRFPRLEAPLGPLLRAEFVLQGRPHVLSVDDLSLGGIGLRVSAHEGAGLRPGLSLPQVLLELGQKQPLRVGLEICSRRAFRSFLAGEQLHFGCRFTELDAATEAELQRIIGRFDADRRLRRPHP